MCAENLLHVAFSCCVMKIALFCMYVMLKEIFISFYEFVPAAQTKKSAFDILHRVVGIPCYSW